jgi:SAM-dependent methyltransferase
MSAPAPFAPIGWNDPRTAEAYEAFCVRHGRYREANATLVAHAALEPASRVLDLGAGTGRTAEAALERLGEAGRILCVEPARAMRAAGEARLSDPRVEWTDALPRSGSFERILLGAAVWQLLPLEATLARLRALVSCGGALVFDVPALYLGEPDEPGGGRDPGLTDLFAELGEERALEMGETVPLPDAEGIDALLETAGFRPERWSFRVRVTQECLRDWLKIPVLTDALLAGLPPLERARKIDAAFERCDTASWRWEAWKGWTAWAV